MNQAMEIGGILGMEFSILEKLFIAVRLHDIGKLAILPGIIHTN